MYNMKIITLHWKETSPKSAMPLSKVSSISHQLLQCNLRERLSKLSNSYYVAVSGCKDKNIGQGKHTDNGFSLNIFLRTSSRGELIQIVICEPQKHTHVLSTTIEMYLLCFNTQGHSLNTSAAKQTIKWRQTRAYSILQKCYFFCQSAESTIKRNVKQTLAITGISDLYKLTLQLCRYLTS